MKSNRIKRSSCTAVTCRGVEKGAKDPPRVVFIKLFWKSIDDWMLLLNGMLLLNARLLFIIAPAGGIYGIKGMCISFDEDCNNNPRYIWGRFFGGGGHGTIISGCY